MTKKIYQLKRPYERKVRFSKEENEYLSKRIEKSPFNNFQNYARILCLTGEIKVVDYSELYQLQWEVNKIGHNVNQLVKLANKFEEVSTDDIQKVQSTIEELMTLVSNKLKEELKKETTC